MSTDLQDLYTKLEYIREYLVKIGPERRQKEIAYKKLEEAKSLYKRLDYILSQVNVEIESLKLDRKTIDSLQKISNDIQCVFKKIEALVAYVDSSSQTSIENISENMADFDIRTAIALLPVMTGQEQVTKQLIDGIVLYNSMITEKTRNQLIEFVLKTRLSANAKLRLKTSYSSAQDLVSDIQKYLLPKKSPQAIQSQLFRAIQGRRSIESFGSELEELFVNLTIAQSDNDSQKFDVLRPINEKTAIKRFADGLTDQRLSTIIASRQFSSLPEAIRAAVDEHTTSNGDHVMQYRPFYRENNNYKRSSRGNGKNNGSFQNQFRNTYNRNQSTTFVNSGQKNAYSNNRNTYSRAPSASRTRPRGASSQQVQPSTSTNRSASDLGLRKDDRKAKFFRAQSKE